MKGREPDNRKAAAVIALDQAVRGRSAGDPSARMAQGAHTLLRASLLATLSAHRVPDTLAHGLAEDAAKSGHNDPSHALAAALEIRMQAQPIDYVNTTALLLKGIHGAGKSTVAAKIAVQAHLTGRDVRIVAFDPSSPPLQRPVKELGIKISVARTAQTILKAIEDAGKRHAFAIVDTHGFNPRHPKARAAFTALSQAGRVQTIGVVSALYDAAEIGDIIAALDAQRLIVTGLDLIRRAGALTIAATQRTPIAHVARSHFAGDGLEPITPMALAHLLLGIRPGLQ